MSTQPPDSVDTRTSANDTQPQRSGMLPDSGTTRRFGLRGELTDVRTARSRRLVVSTLFQLSLLFLLLLLIAVASGRTNIIRVPWLSGNANEDGNTTSAASPIPAPVPTSAVPTIPPVPPQIDTRFTNYYYANGGQAIFGDPISPLVQYQGRWVQWFERARLEDWSGSAWPVQGGLLGNEYTSTINFSQTAYFPSTPSSYFFAETGQPLGGAFLDFWRARGGLVVFGYPISGELNEVLSDGREYLVQYFERARLELPLGAGGDQVRVGLLGRELFLRDGKPGYPPATGPERQP